MPGFGDGAVTATPMDDPTVPGVGVAGDAWLHSGGTVGEGRLWLGCDVCPESRTDKCLASEHTALSGNVHVELLSPSEGPIPGLTPYPVLRVCWESVTIQKKARVSCPQLGPPPWNT